MVYDSLILHHGMTNKESSVGFSPFEYVAPTPESVEKIKKIRDAMRSLNDLILETIPVSRERSLAITKLEESSMWANKAIVFTQK